MKNKVNCLIGLLVIAAAGCTVTVNGKTTRYGLDGEVIEDKKPGEDAKDPKKDGDNPSVDELAAAVAAGATSTPGQAITLKADFSPNPNVLGTFSTKAEVSVRDQPHGIERCSGFVGSGAVATLTFTKSMKDTRISAPGARLIVAEFGDSKYVCDEGGYNNNAPSVKLDEWPTTPIRIYVGGRKGESYNFDLKVEDEKRPIDITWKDKVKPVDVDEVPKDPLVISQMTSSKAGAKGSRCGNDFYFREVPDMAFQLKRPLGEMSIGLRSAKKLDAQVVGPLTADGRNLPVQCIRGNDRVGFSRMEPGLYAIFVGTEAPSAEVLYHVVVRGKDTSRNPVQAPSKFPDQIALNESVLEWHYPQLWESDTNGEPNRESLFLSAPKALFVFPKFNMDKSVASGIGIDVDEKGKSTIEFPKENEPLLLVTGGGRVMAADGSIFQVNMKDLQADPGGAVVVPAAPRNLTLTFDNSMSQQGPEDKAAVASYQRTLDAEDDCHDRFKTNIFVRVVNPCAAQEKASETAGDNLMKSLARTRAKRRATSLAKIKTRLEDLFKK